MRTTVYMMMAGASLALAACDAAQETAPMADTPMAEAEMAIDDEIGMPGEMDMPGGMMEGAEAGRTASADGTVTAIDDAAGTITIDHSPVPAMDWPAMNMAFTASEEQRASVAKGDSVTFEFRETDAGTEILSLTKD
ncbi:MAG: copper-binding protein [Pacificimonas sp.]